MATSPSDRCDYRPDIGLADGDLPNEPCDRPIWNDHDRCVWHAKVDGKSIELFDDARPEPQENLDGAYLRGASLVGVDWFADTSMIGADLTNAEVNAADFSGANLMLANLTNVSAISADFSRANLEGAILTETDLRRATLEDALLDEAVLTNVHISGETNFGEFTVYDRRAVEPQLGNQHSLEAASWVYRQLQLLYQENALPQLARRSFNQEKDTRRRLAWDRDDYVGALKWEVSRLVMGYGSSPARVLLTSFIVIVVAALLYPITGGIQETTGGSTITYFIQEPTDPVPSYLFRVYSKSLYFSVITFATLGYGDIRPIGTWARMIASVETILGSLLAALLVFVLARIVTW